MMPGPSFFAKGAAMPAVFEKLGIRFMYPDNWTLDESEALEGNDTVTVYSPDGAFWSIIMHPPGLEPKDLVDAAVDAMRDVYDELDAETGQETIGERTVVSSEMNFYCLDLTNTAIARSFATPTATYLLLCQADDREFEEVGPVFEAITRSLLTSNASGEDFVDSTTESSSVRSRR
jgi:hypothetical protein